MSSALVKVDQDQRFDKMMQSITPFTAHTWSRVESCIGSIFGLSAMSGEILEKVFTFKAFYQEDTEAFARRFESLLRASGLVDSTGHSCIPHEILVGIIYRAVPELGQNLIISHFKDLRQISDFGALLDFIRQTSGLLNGSHAWAGRWAASLWAPDLVTKDPGSSSTPIQAGNKRRRSRSPGRGNRSRPVPRLQELHAKTGLPDGQQWCTHLPCLKLSKRHWDTSCQRHKHKQGNAPSASLSTSSSSSSGPFKSSQRFTPRKKAATHGVKRNVSVNLSDESHSDDEDTIGRDDHYTSTSAHDITQLQKNITISPYSSARTCLNCSCAVENISRRAYLDSFYIKPLSLSLTSTYDAISMHCASPLPPVCRIQCAFRGSAPDDNRIAIPIVINGVEYTALLDTGCTSTSIDPRVADELGIAFGLLEGEQTVLANTKHTIPTYISLDRISLECNGRSVQCQVDVMELDYFDCYIGMDLAARFGIKIAGFLMKKQPLSDLYIISDKKPSIVASSRPPKELTDEFITQRSEFMVDISPYLADNATIDPQSFCPHPFMKVELKVKDGAVVYQRSHRPFSQSQQGEVDTQVSKWIQDGVIVTAPHGTPHLNKLTVSARKDLDGNILKYRVCLDPRHLNSLLEDSDNFLLPLISDILEKTAGHKFFSTLDLRQAYHRLPLSKESQPYTAFMHDGKQYMFARAPFGLKPMTSIFQRGMSLILGDLPFVAVYVDDIVVYSDTAEEHRVHVQTVIDRLTQANLIINPEKCNFFCTEVVLLGFIIDEHGRRIVPEKVANIQSWAPPTNGKMVQRYLGMFNYFREYIPLYSTLAAPLDELRVRKGNFVLTELQLECFNQIKYLIARAPVLSFPDFNLPFYVATDASNLGIGCVLYQLPNGPDDESVVHYISFMARSLKKHERNYPAYKKELLGIVYALKKFHYYLWGRSFTLLTDHRPLTYIQHQSDLPATIANWTETILSHHFECIYRPGLLNIIPDALSRAFPDELWSSSSSSHSDQLEHHSKRHKSAAVSTRRGLRKVEHENMTSVVSSASSQELAAHISSTQIDPLAPYVHQHQTRDVEKLIPDKAEHQNLLKATHGQAHLGANAMVNALHLQGVTWPKLKESCLQFIRQCSACQHYNIARSGYHPLKAIHATLPGEHLAMDLAQFPKSNNKKQYALIVVDVCTRFIFLHVLKSKDALAIAKKLLHLFRDIGPPKIIQSDNGSEFSNSKLNAVLTILKTEHRLSTPYHPRGNGIAERSVRSVKDLLPKVLEGKVLDWDLYLPMVQLQLNTKVASLHSSTPFSLFYGRAFAGFSNFEAAKSQLLGPKDLDLRLEYLTNIVFPAISEKSTASQKQMIAKFNRSHLITEFPPGSHVMVKDMEATGSLDAPYDGPFKVVCRSTHGTYVLRDTMNRLLARNYAPEQLKLAFYSEDPSTAADTHEVERVVGHRTTKEGETLYMVKWTGYDDSWNKEIPYKNINSKSLITRYYKKLNQINPHTTTTKSAGLTTAPKSNGYSAFQSTSTLTRSSRSTRSKI
jgi:transposase InsO family protein